jgi:lipid A 3-O-deacylase
VKLLRCRSQRWLLSLAVLGAITTLPSPAHADDPVPDDSSWGRITIMEENDKISSSGDKHYTQGMRLSYLSGRVTPDGWWDQPYGWLSNNLPIFDGSDRKRKYEATLGQNLFTPANTARINPSPKDRPYAAWLYTGASLLQETNQESHHTLENAELLMGVVGAAALGDVTQNDFHQFINVSQAMGWRNQVKNEPGFIASYERKWRFQKALIGNLAVDAIPELGVSVGNILTYGQAGAMVRFGQNLGADYGPNRIRPSLSGTGWFDPDALDGDLGWYVFLGTQSRIVGRNIFLDGNSFERSPSVEKKLFVTDFTGGASVFWSSSVRIDFTITDRTKEFYGQHGHVDRFGAINLTFQL